MKTMPNGSPWLSPIGKVRLGVAGDCGGAIAGAGEVVAIDRVGQPRR